MMTTVVFTLRQAQGDNFHSFAELAGDLGDINLRLKMTTFGLLPLFANPGLVPSYNPL
jgi:hypothetical protein